MHRVFISYHHANDQWYKDTLVKWAEDNEIFEDWSVDTGDIPDSWSDEEIREEIRDNYLRSSSVTIVLVGTETKNRKHVDWELYSSMHDGTVNKKSGIIAVMLPSTGCTHVYAGHTGEKADIFPSYTWDEVKSRSQCDEDYPFLPERIKDQLLADGAKVSVAKWSDFYPNYPERLKTLIDNAYDDRASCEYDMTRPMKRRNS